MRIFGWRSAEIEGGVHAAVVADVRSGFITTGTDFLWSGVAGDDEDALGREAPGHR
jgi:hypothetical protein